MVYNPQNLQWQLGQSYGVPTAAMVDAVRLVAQTEGLLLDLGYGGKAFAGLLAAVRRDAGSHFLSMLFIMTGGGAGLFADKPEFRS